MSNQSYDFSFSVPLDNRAISSSTFINLLDQSMPEFMEQTADFTLSETRVEHEEFILNETIIELIEEMLETVDNEHKRLKQDAKEAINLVEQKNDEVVNGDHQNEYDDDDDDVVDEDDDVLQTSSKSSSKRQMNESIMSIDDPMLIDSKKMKNKLNNSIMVESEKMDDKSPNCSPHKSFNLGEMMMQQIENKENLNPQTASPNVSGDFERESNEKPDLQHCANNRFISDLITFASPAVEKIAPNPQLFSSVTAAPSVTIHSPKRAVFTELESDLFGVIYAKNSPEKSPIAASNLLSVSIFAPALTPESDEKRTIQIAGEDEDEQSGNSTDQHCSRSITGGNASLSIQSLSIEGGSKIPINTDSIESVATISINESNFENELKACDQEMDSFDDDDDDDDDDRIDSSAATTIADGGDAQLENQQPEENSRTQIEDSSSAVLPVATSAGDPQLTIAPIDNRQIETKIYYESQIVDLHGQIEFLESQLMMNVTADAAATTHSISSIMDDKVDETISLFSILDHVNAVKSSVDYEEKIAQLMQQIEQLQAQLQHQQQQSHTCDTETKIDCDCSFSINDQLGALVETKLSYENEIIDLHEKIEQLEGEVAAKDLDAARLAETKVSNEIEIDALRATVRRMQDDRESSSDQAAKSKKAEESTEQLEATTASSDITFSYDDRMNLIETKLSYENEIIDLQERLDRVQREMAENRAEFERAIEAQKVQVANISLQTSIIMTNDDHDESFADGHDRSRLIEAKQAYENDIVRLREKIERISLLIDQKLDTTTTSEENDDEIAEMTFSADDRIRLIETKLEYESQIVELTERIQAKQHAIEQAEAAERGVMQEFAAAKAEYESGLHAQKSIIETMTHEIARLKANVASQDSQHVQRCSQLEQTIDALQADIGAYREKYETELVPEHEALKRQFDELSAAQIDVNNENRNYREAMLEMDEERAAMRRKFADNCARLNAQIGELQSREKRLVEETESRQRGDQQLIDQLRSDLARCEESARDAQSQRSILAAENERLRCELETRDREIAQRIEELNEKNKIAFEQYNTLADELSSERDVLRTYQLMNEDIEDENQCLRRELAESRSNCDSIRAAMREEIDRMKAQMVDRNSVEIDAQRRKAEEEIVAVRAQLSIVEKRCDELCAELDAAKRAAASDKASAEILIAQANEEATKLSDKLRESETEIGTIRADSDAKTAQIEQLVSRLTASQTEQSSLADRIAELATTIEDLSLQNKSLETRLASSDEEREKVMSDLRDRLAAAQQSRVTQQAELDDARRELESLRERMQKLSSHNDQLRAEARQAEIDRENQDKAAKLCKKKHESVVAELEQQIGTMRGTIAELETRLAESLAANSEIRDRSDAACRAASERAAQIEQSLAAKIAKLESRNQTLDAERSNLIADLAAANERLQAFADDFAAIDSTLRQAFSSSASISAIESDQADSSSSFETRLTKLIESYTDAISKSRQSADADRAKFELDIQTAERQIRIKDTMIEQQQSMLNQASATERRLADEKIQLEREIADAADQARDLARQNESKQEARVAAIVDEHERRLCAESDAKRSIEQTFDRYVERFRQAQVMIHQNQAKYRLTLAAYTPIREHLIASNKAAEKLMSDMKNLTRKISETPEHRESVKSEVVKKILLTIYEKLKKMTDENAKTLSETIQPKQSSQSSSSSSSVPFVAPLPPTTTIEKIDDANKEN